MKYYKANLDENITALIDEVDLNLYMADNENWKAPVFVPFFNNENELESLWGDVSDVIATSFQTNLKGADNSFQKWNLYIIYVCSATVSKELKSKIENNKFSSRKIVVGRFEGELSNDKVNELIIKHVTSTDLMETVNDTIENVESKYEPVNKEFWKLIPKEKLLIRNTDLQDKIFKQFEMIENEN